MRQKVDVWAYSGWNVKTALDNTIWGSFESSWALENDKNKEKKLRPKMDVWAYSVLNFKSPLNHTIWGSFKSSWKRKNNKIKNRHRQAKWSSIESWRDKKDGKNVNKYKKTFCTKMDILTSRRIILKVVLTNQYGPN